MGAVGTEEEEGQTTPKMGTVGTHPCLRDCAVKNLVVVPTSSLRLPHWKLEVQLSHLFSYLPIY